MKREILGTQQKALQINLDPMPYGTFAEIGAGQEVARWFFRVGAAAGTIAKTMSAYDMTVSDAIYGPSQRYVSRQRLQPMLDHEYRLLMERLEPRRGQTTRFFAFADTVATRSYDREEEARGWVGVKFQAAPRAEASQIMIHVRMLDHEVVLEQEALGIIGVNLLFGALYLHDEPQTLIASLLDHLDRERIEVDLIKFDGPAFPGIDNRLMSLQLVQQGLTESALFTASGEVVQAAEVLYKRPILVVRGSFRPVTNATIDLIERARTQYPQATGIDRESIVVLMEMTLRHLAEDGVIDHQSFLNRADTLGLLGYPVLVSSYARYFRLAAYLLRHSRHRIAIAMGVRRLRELFDDQYYADLEGGILEALGRMFKNDLRLYIYPVDEGPENHRLTAANLEVAPHLRHLYAHLFENGCIQDIEGYQAAHLKIFARDVLAAIRRGDDSWEPLVPDQVASMIKERRLFGYPDSSGA